MMRPFRVSRLCQWRQALHQPRRHYAVRAPGHDQNHIRTVADLKSWKPDGPVPDVEVCGWVRSVRKSSGVRFVDVTDGSSMRPVQAVVDKALSAEIRPGAAVRLKGSWRNETSSEDVDFSGHQVSDPASLAQEALAGGSAAEMLDTRHTVNNASNNGDQSSGTPPAVVELQVNEVEILGPSDPQTYPIQNKYQTPESLRTISHLRSRTPLNSTLLRFRSDVTALLTEFFFHEKFRQTHPPIITSSDCEGAGEAFGVKASNTDEFFRTPKYLTVSAQLHLEALAQALGNVWTLSPTFRAEQSDTSRHLSEFYMLEAEMSFVQDMDQVMDLLQRMLYSLAHGLKQLRAATELESNRLDSKDPAERLAFEDLVERKELQRRWRGLLIKRKWPRITYTEAISLLQPVADQFEHKPVWGAGLQSEHEKYLAKEVGYDAESDAYVPLFITQYPREIKAFYMLQSSSPPSQGPTVDCFDLLVPDLGELAGGSMREHRLSELQDNMKLHGLEVSKGRKAKENDPLAWYLDLRRWGCPPHGGFGMGFDRLLSYITGVPNVRDVVPFPRHHQRCDC
ncbi:Asparagine--tRNA ligase [Paramyrothecium foliicola]|nr:Asparagine--tRNA ligase [Paramyrothecium foliicola]